MFGELEKYPELIILLFFFYIETVLECLNCLNVLKLSHSTGPHLFIIYRSEFLYVLLTSSIMFTYVCHFIRNLYELVW